MSTQTSLLLDMPVRPPVERCVCGRPLRWHEHRASDGEIDWLVNWFSDQCRCGIRMTWKPERETGR